MSYAGRTCSIWTGPNVSTITAINWFLFHWRFLRDKVLRRLQFLQVVIQRWIQRSVSLQQVATALGREPDWCWVLVPQDTSTATSGTDSHCGLEKAAQPRSHGHLHMLSAVPTRAPPPQPVPGDGLRQGVGRSFGGSLGHPTAVPGRQDLADGQHSTKQIRNQSQGWSKVL